MLKRFQGIFISVMVILSTIFSGGMSVSATTPTVYIHETNVDFSHIYEKSSGITLSTFFHDKDPSGTGFPYCFSVTPGQQHITYKANGPISWFFLQAAVNRSVVTDYATNINNYINVSFSNDNVTYKSLKAGTTGPGNDYLFIFPTTPKNNVSATTLANTSLGNSTLLGGNFGDMRFDNHPWTTGFNVFDSDIRYIRLDFNYTPAAPNSSTPVFYLLESGFQYTATNPTASVANPGAVPARNYFDIQFSDIMNDATMIPGSFTIPGSTITVTSTEKIDSANNIWRIHLSDYLLPNHNYTINLASSIVSTANLTLAANSMQFTTGAVQRGSISLSGPKVVKIPASGGISKIQLRGNILNSDGTQDITSSIIWSLVNNTDPAVSINSQGVITVNSSAVPQSVTVNAASSTDSTVSATKDITITSGLRYSLFEDFNGYQTASFANGTNNWTVNNDIYNGTTNTNVNIVEDPGATNKSIKLNNINAAQDPNKNYYGCDIEYKNATAITNKAVIEFGVKFNNLKIWNYPLNVGPVVLITNTGSDGKTYLDYRLYKNSSTSASWPQITEIQAGQWYHIKVVHDLRPSAQGGQKADIYLNYSNTPVLQGQTFYEGTYPDLSSINSFYAQTTNSAPMSMQIDNILMYDPNMLDVMTISGNAQINIPATGSTTSTYMVSKFKTAGGDDFTPTQPVTWTLNYAPDGVTVDSNTGVITVQSGIKLGKVVELVAHYGVYENYTAAKKILINASVVNGVDISLKDNVGKPIDYLQAGTTVNASIDLQNTTDSNQSIMFAAVLYNKNGVLEKMSVCPTQSLSVSANWITLQTSLQLPSVLDGEYIKVFLWNDPDKMQPSIKPYICYSTNPSATVYLIGDSIVESYDYSYNDPYTGVSTTNYYPQAGWGQVLGARFNSNNSIKNYALGGRSSGSYLLEQNWTTIKNSMKAGDYLFIQFGHNDKWKDGADPNTIYKQNLATYAKEARSRGVIPVLVTSPNLMYFENGVSTNQIGGFPQAMRDFANDLQNNVSLIDLNTQSIALENSLGLEGCKQHIFLFYLVEQNLLTADQLAVHPNVSARTGLDTTHLKLEGANIFADLVVEGIHSLKLPLEQLLKN